MTRLDYINCGFRRIICAAPAVKIADVCHNVAQIRNIMKAHTEADIILFPELSVTGYTCADLFGQEALLDAALSGIRAVAEASRFSGSLVVVGAPLRHLGALYNCAIFICRGKILAVVPKIHIPDYSEYYEARWWRSGADIMPGTRIDLGEGAEAEFTPYQIIDYRDMKIAAEICEDLWTPAPPSSFLAMQGAEVILNLSASNETIGKHHYRRTLICQQSARCRCVYAYASAGAGESSTDLAFPGYTAVAEDGTILSESPRFPEGALITAADIDLQKIRHDRLHTGTFLPPAAAAPQGAPRCVIRKAECGGEEYDHTASPMHEEMKIDPHPFVPADKEHRNENCTDIISIQCHGLAQRLQAIGCRTLVIGVSGGLDSTLALLVACRTFDRMGLPRKGIMAITMPGLATTSKTHDNAWQLMELLGTTCIEIPIGKAVAQHFSDLDHDPNLHDATYENSQARERTQILMDYANKCGGIVLGTGDLSELALGWCTYNGDQMSMYGVNASVPKTLVRHLVEWFADRAADPRIAHVLMDIVATPISPELVPAEGDDPDTIAQKTEDLIGPYELHDFFLYNTLRYGFTPTKVFLLARMAFSGVYSDAVLLKWMRNFYRRFFSQQFKRSCMPDGPKVGSVCLSPRGDWRMPSDASARLWLDEVTQLEKRFLK